MGFWFNLGSQYPILLNSGVSCSLAITLGIRRAYSQCSKEGNLISDGRISLRNKAEDNVIQSDLSGLLKGSTHLFSDIKRG